MPADADDMIPSLILLTKNRRSKETAILSAKKMVKSIRIGYNL